MDNDSSRIVVDTEIQDTSLDLAASDPLHCIDLLRRGLDPCGLRQGLQDADQTWIEQFLQSGGLSDLFLNLEKRGDTLSDPNDQQECIACVKAVLNHKLGLEFILEQQGEYYYIRKLVQVLDTDCVVMKQDIFELLSALCLYSDKGYNLSLDAMQSYKQSRCERYRFSVLMQEMRQSSSEQYLASIMAFINCILARADGLDKRIRLRNEFLALQLSDVLSLWRHTTNEALALQIQAFYEAQAKDNALMDMPGGININSLEDVFNAVLNKVRCTPHELPLLNILQSFLLLERDDPTSDTVWGAIEQFCNQAVHMGNPGSQSDQLKDASIAKLRAILQKVDVPTEMVATDLPEEKESGVENESINSLPSPPPPPAPPPVPGNLGAPPPPPPPPGSAGMTDGPAATPEKMTKVAKSREYKPQKQMNKVYWSKLSRGEASNAGVVWQKAAEGEMDTEIDIDPASVEDLFAKPEVKVKEKTKNEGKKGQAVRVFDLDPVTERNTMINLRGLDMDNSTLVDTIDKGEPLNMTALQLKSLEQQLSNDHVKQQLESHRGAHGDFPDSSSQGKNHGKVQDFFLQLTRVTRPDLRVKLMRAHVQFNDELATLEPPISTVEHAIDEVLKCETLTQILLVILTAGNIINGGTYAGRAFGFKIESLSRLKETKQKHPQMSFVHFITELCEEQSPNPVVHIIDELLPCLEEASKHSYENLCKEIDKVQEKIGKFEKEMKEEFTKKSPDDQLKAKFDKFSEEVYKSLEKFEETLERISQKKDQLAIYFCEESKSLKLEELLKQLLSFVTDLKKAREDNKQKKVLDRKRKEAAEKRKRNNAAAQMVKNYRIQSDSDEVDGAEPELEKEDKRVIDDLLMKIKAGLFTLDDEI